MTLPASLKALLVAAALSGGISAHAETFRLPEGLVLEAPDDLEITYQNVPAYDASKKVVVGWDNG
ncbi:MAG TPA: hypothetical protein PKZ19_06550, partial [Zoogloea sp.]|nr:hypothetical protein [Zoogloea sp.]